jgi:hypothetical protein
MRSRKLSVKSLPDQAGLTSNDLWKACHEGPKVLLKNIEDLESHPSGRSEAHEDDTAYHESGKYE